MKANMKAKTMSFEPTYRRLFRAWQKKQAKEAAASKTSTAPTGFRAHYLKTRKQA